MNIIKKIFQPEKKEGLVITTSPTEILVKTEKIFDIYKDGNGVIRAKHKSGKWLRDKENLIDFYVHAFKFSSVNQCHEMAEYYIRSLELTKIGTIEFIPNK